MLLFSLLHVLVHVALRRPWIYQRLLVVGRLLTMRSLAIASLCLGELLVDQVAIPELRRGRLVLLAIIAPPIMQIRGLLLPLLHKIGALLLAGSASFLITLRIVLQVGVLDLSLVGCSPLLLRLPLTRVVPLLASARLLIQ